MTRKDPTERNIVKKLSLLSEASMVAGRDSEEVEEEEISSQSTGSWDFSWFTGSNAESSLAADEVFPKNDDRAENLVAMELEHQVVFFLQHQVKTLQTELKLKSTKIEDQACTIQEMEEAFHSKQDLVRENHRMASMIAQQEEKIQELQEKLQNSDVTLRFYEAEEEINTLRNELKESSELIQQILIATDALCTLDRKISQIPHNTYSCLMKGSERMENNTKLHDLAVEFASHVLRLDNKLAVTFLANSHGQDSIDTKSNVINATTKHCLDVIRADPALVLERSSELAYFHKDLIEFLLKDVKMSATRMTTLTKFRILQLWYTHATPEEQEKRLDTVKQLLCRYVALERIDPLELSTTVRSSGLVSDSMLCDAFGKQAADKTIVENQPKYDDPITISKKVYWDGLNSDVLNTTDPSLRSLWNTRVIGSNVIKVDTNKNYSWELYVEKSGYAILGVVNASFNRDNDEACAFGYFLPRNYFCKGALISLTLSHDCHDRHCPFSFSSCSCSHHGSRGWLTATTSLLRNGGNDGENESDDWSQTIPVEGSDRLLVAASIRGGSVLRFVRFL